MTYTLLLGTGIYLVAAMLFYGYLLMTSKPETGKVFPE